MHLHTAVAVTSLLFAMIASTEAAQNHYYGKSEPATIHVVISATTEYEPEEKYAPRYVPKYVPQYYPAPYSTPGYVHSHQQHDNGIDQGDGNYNNGYVHFDQLVHVFGPRPYEYERYRQQVGNSLQKDNTDSVLLNKKPKYGKH